MTRHDQMVQNILYELYPDDSLDNVSEEKRKNLIELIELYLDPKTPESRKKAILKQLHTTKMLAESLYPITEETENTEHDTIDKTLSGMMPKRKNTKAFSPQINQSVDFMSSLVLLCFMNNDAILKMQTEQQNVLEEQQRILTSLIELQQESLQRDQEMLSIINKQQETIREQQELLKKCTKRGNM